MTDSTATPTSPGPPAKTGWAGFFLNGLVGTAILFAAIGLCGYWLTHRPQARRQPPQEKAALVEVVALHRKTHPITVRAMGKVVPATEVKLVARVSGQLVQVSPALEPGGFVARGDTLARVDPRDYRLAVAEAQAALKQAALTGTERQLAIAQKALAVALAEKELTLEEAKRAVARSDYDLLIETGSGMDKDPVQAFVEVDRDTSTAPDTTGPLYRSLGKDITEGERQLILRTPYLKAAKASLAAAQAGHKQAQAAYRNAQAARTKAESTLEKARLNLEWTAITAPFDALVLDKHVGTGSFVSSGIPVATLVDTTRYWLEVSIPVRHLRWLKRPDPNGKDGSTAEIRHPSAWGPTAFRSGRVRRVQPAIETEGRMARVLVEVRDPCALQPENEGKPVLLLDACVSVAIAGPPMTTAFRLPRTALRDGDRVWILNAAGELDIRPVTIAYRAPEYVLVTAGLEEGMRLITSDIPTPVAGMALRAAKAAEDQEVPADG